MLARSEESGFLSQSGRSGEKGNACRGQTHRITQDLIPYFPMAITRKRKTEIVSNLKDIVANAGTVAFVRFNGITSEEANALRLACADENVGYVVAKKTLIKRAFDETEGIAGDFPELEGEIALAYSTDTMACARVIHAQAKKLDGRLGLVGALFERKLVPQETIRMIAEIPPLETLYAQFLTVIRAPVSGLASVLGQVADKRQ